MQALMKKAALASALALIGTNGAYASVVAPTVAGGSEAILTIINNADKSNVSIDLGETISQLAAGQTFSLSTFIQNYITGAGGLGGVNFMVQAGNTTGGAPGLGQYLTTSANASLGTVANSVANGSWKTAITNYTGALNSGDVSATSANNDYGPYGNANPDSGNVLGFGYNVWNAATQADGSALGNLNLFLVTRSSTNNFAATTITSPWAGAQAQLNLSSLTLLPAVPVPAAAWLFGSALGLLSLSRRK